MHLTDIAMRRASWRIAVVGGSAFVFKPWAALLNPTNMNLKEQLLERIKMLSEPEMIEVAHALNSWKTHPLIADIQPGSWSWPGEEQIRKAPQAIAMRYVTETVGRKAQLRFHNVTKGRMTEEEFEAWWNKDGWHGLEEL